MLMMSPLCNFGSMLGTRDLGIIASGVSRSRASSLEMPARLSALLTM